MSQLDVCISFTQLYGVVLVFYLFIIYVSIYFNQFWYNQKIRLSSDLSSIENLSKFNKSINLMKRILII